MSIETRSGSALSKRAEQLKRWEQSDTNREPVSPKQKNRKIKFSSGCVFLAACAASDKDEVLRLIQKGADINTANVDGLTALHQACIDDNLDMVEFLVEHGADVNRGDNEGWTPLHATASCGFQSIAKYLLEHGADVAAVNNDGELAVDIAEEQSMEDLLQKEINDRGINCDEARSQEERMMLRDAKEWLNSGSDQVDTPHPKTGATALHVAAAKGYINVMNILLQCKADIDKQDHDGWTPLHAASHWGQFDAAKILADNLADMEMKNVVGQTAFDVADTEMFRHLEDLQKRQNKEELLSKKQAKKRAEASNRRPEPEPQTPTKVKRVEVDIKNVQNEKDVSCNNTDEAIGGIDVSSSDSETETETSTESETSYDNSTDDEKKNRVNSQTEQPRNVSKEQITINAGIGATKTVNNSDVITNFTVPTVPPPKHVEEQNTDDNTPSWRRPGSFRSKINDNKNLNLRIGLTSNKDKVSANNSLDQEITLRRTQSFQSDPKFYARYLELHERIKASSQSIVSSFLNPSLLFRPTCSSLEILPITTSQTDNSSQRLPNTRNPTKELTESVESEATNNGANSPTKVTQSPASSPQPNNQIRSNQKPPVGANQANNASSSTPTTPSGTKLSAGNIFKNFFKSFVPPVRDEESETQRKAHAKRVRETRRSTQGVTLDEIKSAEQLVKKKNQTVNNNNNDQSGANGEPENGASVTATITTAVPTVPTHKDTEDSVATHERRPSWRLRVDNGSKFKLEDATITPEQLPTVYVRRPSNSNVTVNSITRPASAPGEVPTIDATVTLSLRRPKLQDDKEQDKENDARNAQATLATQAAIQRRRRPKRRSTGVVHMDEIDPDRQEQSSGGDFDETSQVNHQESGSEKSSRSRLGSASDLASLRGENGELDYKKMYEQTLAENDRLRDKLRKSEEELRDTKQTLEKLNTVTSKNSLSELEKRERRAMERKLSEMEEELKQLQKLKAENERLRAENRALTRVVSKLTNSTGK